VTAPTYEQMQEGELAWWRGFLSNPHAIPRLFAVYGYRYLPFFFEEFGHLGHVVDIGSGPVSAAYIGEPAPEHPYCVDPLMFCYQDAGLIYGEPHWWGVPPDPFDTALLLNVLDHVNDPAALVAKTARSLCSGGKALVWNHVDALADGLHRTVTTFEIDGWLADAGLDIVRARYHQDYGPLAYMAVARRA
jgi:SAM-dependent methyltransferase